ncbi:MAG: ABC transporter permease [Actinomadura rubrobrunea]|nr:ABC transporter permease [Actinomadura rubrobrunea]
MTALSLAVTDSATMLRRQLRHMLRYPSLTVQLMGMPVIFLLLFVYVFGGTLGAGLGGAPGNGTGGRDEYLAYVTPGILLMTVGMSAAGTAIAVAMDMTEGIVARFRTMAISRSSVLTGHVLGSMVQMLLAVAAVLGAAVAIGFRPHAGPLEWLAALGMLLLFILAITWLSVALGARARTVESASNAPMPLMLLPFLGSGFVPTDSMPDGLRWFADHQPFTPVIETLRGLLLGTEIGDSAATASAWCAGTTVACFLWARRLYERAPSR